MGEVFDGPHAVWCFHMIEKDTTSAEHPDIGKPRTSTGHDYKFVNKTAESKGHKKTETGETIPGSEDGKENTHPTDEEG